MQVQTAYSLMKSAGMTPEKAAAISRIFGVVDTPETRESLIADMEKAGVSEKGAHLLIDIFLDRQKQHEKSH